VIPVDGILESAAGVLDESALTGESRPVERTRGEQLQRRRQRRCRLPPRAVATAAESTYAGIIRLVEEASAREGALRAPGGPVRVDLRPRDACGRGPCVGDQRRCRPGPRGARGRHALPADPGGPDRDRSRHLESGQARDHRQRRWSVGGARPRTRPAVRQDRHPDRGSPELADVETFDHGSPEEVLSLAASLDQVSPTCSLARSCARLGSVGWTSPSRRTFMGRAARDPRPRRWPGGRHRQGGPG
jgi:hypothetical protein